jgi:PRTRC genetic system protein C
MALQASALPREFFYNGSRISDPDPKMEIDQVRELLTPSYPEIATATMTGPEDTGTALRYTSLAPSARRAEACLAGFGSAAMSCWHCSPRERQRRHRKRISYLRGISNAKLQCISPKRSQKRCTASAATTHIPSKLRQSCCHQ